MVEPTERQRAKADTSERRPASCGTLTLSGEGDGGGVLGDVREGGEGGGMI